MYDKLIVFQEKNFLLGLFPEDFKNHISLDEIKISPYQNFSLWNFQTKNGQMQGILVHPGSFFNDSALNFSHTAHIFIKKFNGITFGILMENYYQKIHMQKAGQRQIGINQVKNLPYSIPKSAFRYVYLYNHRKIFVLDPLLLFRSYKELFPVNY